MFARLQQFRFDWTLTLLTAVLLPLLVSLGFWQLRREQEKLALQDAYASRQMEAPVALIMLNPAADLQYRQVELRGNFDNAHTFLLDNRIHQGRAGYEVITPLTTDGNQKVFINRGWIAQGPSRTELPTIAVLEEQHMLRGSIHVPLGDPFVLGEAAATEGWPQVIQTLDLMRMAQAAGYAGASLFPYTIRLADGAPGVLVRDWPVVSTSPEKHRGYAVQWFAMATMLLGLYLYYSTRPESAN